MIRHLSSLLCIAALAAWGSLLTGCGSGSATVPYEGVVTLNGEPLADAMVTLLPLTATDPGPFSGTTDTSGKFSLGPTASPNQRGVVPNKYRLMISTLKVAPMEGGDDSARPKVLAPERVPEEYRTGNMRFEVTAEGTTAANFDISGRP